MMFRRKKTEGEPSPPPMKTESPDSTWNIPPELGFPSSIDYPTGMNQARWAKSVLAKKTSDPGYSKAIKLLEDLHGEWQIAGGEIAGSDYRLGVEAGHRLAIEQLRLAQEKGTTL